MAKKQNNSELSMNINDKLFVQTKYPTTTATIEIRSARSKTCYICLETIVTMHKQFSLQNNCDYFFCFDCLSTCHP